ncbi:MAG TPA: peptidoglycan-binding protein [Clostridia bacterium]|nr:peptidoglycan-binding protein [Clostridia bacterium]
MCCKKVRLFLSFALILTLVLSINIVTVSAAGTLRPNMESSDITALQQDLKALGYFNAECTGFYGSITEASVRKFQQDNGLAVDGIAGPKTLAKIKEKSSSSSSNTSTTQGNTNIVLKMGATGNDVTDLQKALERLGYFKAGKYGYYGSITRDAVIKFQKDNGLVADGIAGKNTLSVLYGTKRTVALSPEKPSVSDETLRPGFESEAVKQLQLKLKELGFFSGNATGYYGTVTTQAVKNFQKSAGLTADGIAGPNTLAALNDPDTDVKPSKAPVEMADWWTVVSKVFARGGKATVTDVLTGISYNVVRYGGTNHADVEPATAADTAKMKQIYGRTWSWDRRAVWVTIDGKRYAGSINGMPHGGQKLNYNDFNGHSCIHFLNSRTHGTNKVDAQHQAAVKYAYEHQ